MRNEVFSFTVPVIIIFSHTEAHGFLMYHAVSPLLLDIFSLRTSHFFHLVSSHFLSIPQHQAYLTFFRKRFHITVLYQSELEIILQKQSRYNFSHKTYCIILILYIISLSLKGTSVIFSHAQYFFFFFPAKSQKIFFFNDYNVLYFYCSTQ